MKTKKHIDVTRRGIRFATRLWLLAALMSFAPGTALAWWNASWNYRVPINVPAGASVNSTIKVDVDFAALLATLGVAGTFDTNSWRIVRTDDATLVTNQEWTDSVYAGATDATGDAQGELRFILQDAGATTYYLYFDIAANGPKAANPQTPINGNLERGGTGTATPPGWTASTRTNANMDTQIRPAETVSVTDSNGSGLTSTTNGNPSTGQFSYLMGYRTNPDNNNSTATLTKDFTVPATSPGSINIRIKPEGWDSAVNGNTANYDFIRVRLLNPSTSAVLLNIAGPQLSNYATCPFSPNYSLNPISNNAPGYGRYNYWDNGRNSNNHTLGMSAAYNRGLEPWTTCTVNLASVAGQAVRLEVRVDNWNQYRTWFLVDDIEWSVVAATIGAPENKPTPPGGFNAYETSTAAGAITGIIKTKIAGQSFNLDLIALNTAKTAIETAFTGEVKVELLDASDNTGPLDANGCRSTWVTIQTLGTNPVFASGNNGRKTVAFQENNAWRDVRVRITYPATGTPTAIGCSNDNFAIRPASFTGVSVTDANWTTAGTTRTLSNTSATGGNVHKTGQYFTISATAINGQATPATTANYDGSPGASLTVCLLPIAPATCTLGTLSPGTWTAVSGTVTTSTATYSEAGAFTMKLVDSTFANVDASDSSTAERYIESAAFDVGRFVPDHFDLTGNTPQFKTFNDATCASRSFTYIGQPFGYVTLPQATITAKNASGATTTNYSGTLWKLVAADLTQTYSYTLMPPSTPGLDSGLIGTSTVTANNDGTGTATANSSDRLAFIRNATTPLAPFTAAITLSMSVADSSESSVAGNGTIVTSTSVLFNGSGSGIDFDSGNEFRYGRLRLSNAHGSELLDLPVSMETQYWNGTLFTLNTADNCTTIAASNISMGNFQKNLSACETSISISGRFSGGRSNLKLTKPGTGNSGSVDLTVHLGASASGNSCAPASIPATAANQSYLQGKWSGASYDQNPTGRATFGVYKNANQFIYLRELY